MRPEPWIAGQARNDKPFLVRWRQGKVHCV